MRNTLRLKIFIRKAINVTKRNLLGTMVNICSKVFGTVIILCSLNSSEISTLNASFFKLISTKASTAEEETTVQRSIRPKEQRVLYRSLALLREGRAENLCLLVDVFELFQ